MTYHYFCNHCNHENRISIKENDRGTFQMYNGDFKETTCKKCFRKDRIHINDIYGKISKALVIAGFSLGLFLSLGLVFIYPNVIIISSAVVSIPTLVLIYESDLVRTFNKYKIKKK
uniref:hypothetical protein n=1 Tax=Flavobacterium sp. TaxID=239 RepID=UPI00404B04C4